MNLNTISLLVFGAHRHYKNSKGNPINGGAKYTGVRKIGNFDNLFHHNVAYGSSILWRPPLSCGRLSWLNCQLSSARYYSIFTYLLAYLRSLF